MIVFSSPIFLLGFSKYRFGKIIALAVIGLAIILNCSYFKTSEYLGREDGYYLNRYIPVPTASSEYRKTSEEYLRLPKGTQARPSDNFPRVYTEVPAIKQINEKNALNAVITTDYEKEFILNYSKYYYPGWFAKIDGKKVRIVAGEPYGQITVLVPKGVHTVEIGYKESPARLIFDLVSLVGIGIATLFIFRKQNE